MTKSSEIRGGLCTSFALAGVLATSVAFAQGTSSTTAAPETALAVPAASGTSVSTSTSGSDKIWLEKLKITLATVYDGPPISALDSNFRTDKGTGYQDDGAPLGVRNDIVVLYPINDQWTIGPTFKFNFHAVPEGRNNLGDPNIRLAKASVYSEGNFSMPGQVRLGLPWSDSSKKKELQTYVLGRLIPTYALPDSKLEFSADTIAKTNFYKRAVFTKGHAQTDFEIYLSPAVGYTLLPNLALNLGYNMGALHELGQPNTDLNNDGTSLQPGFEWGITESLKLSPSIYIFTGDRVAPDTTVTEVGLTWKVM